MSLSKMKLSGVQTLVVDDDQYSTDLLLSMLRGFGIDQPRVLKTAQDARSWLQSHDYDLVICGVELPDAHGAELVEFIRHLSPPNKFAPIIVLTSYSNMSNVTRVRDAGAHIVIKKPVSPRVLYDRIAWAAKSPRSFVETHSYVGPDRRFKFIGPPDGVGRRESDLSGDIGEATEPNLSQAEIDALMKPTRVVTA